jgi:hypothetical protein
MASFRKIFDSIGNLSDVPPPYRRAPEQRVRQDDPLRVMVDDTSY